MNKKIEFRQVRDFGEIINDTFVFARQNWKALLKSYIIFCGFFVLASMMISILNQVKMIDRLNDSPYSFAKNRYGWQYLYGTIVFMISYGVLNLTTCTYIALYVEKGNTAPSTEEVWAYFKFYFFRVIGSNILVTMGLIVAFLLCLFPGFYILPAFSLIIPVIIFENGTLGFGYSRAFQLVKGNYWMVLGVIMVSSIIVYAGLMVFVLPVSILNAMSLLMAGHKFNITYVVLTSVVSHLCYFFWMIICITIALTYFSLAEQKDGTGLMNRIEQLGTTELGTDELPTEEY